MDPEDFMSGACSEHRGAEGPEALGGSGGMLPRKISKNRCPKIHIWCILKTKKTNILLLEQKPNACNFPQINSFEVTIWFKLNKFPQKISLVVY